jgi:hypothetical protein
MVFRTRHKVHGKSVYAKRNKKGQFVNIENIGRSLRADARIKARHVPKYARHGFEGDYRKGQHVHVHIHLHHKKHHKRHNSYRGGLGFTPGFSNWR